MGDDAGDRPNTTHDWTATVDRYHLDQVRRAPEVFAPGGVTHLVLEVLAYAAEEAAETGRTGHCVLILHADGSVSMIDDGRGTDTRTDGDAPPVRKPVMATRDLRFFDSTDPPPLPDGHPRRGISTVAALSTWLVHTNHRVNGSWTQRYEHGIPVTGLVPVEAPPSTGTTVHFLPAPAVASAEAISTSALQRAATAWPHLQIEVLDQRSR